MRISMDVWEYEELKKSSEILEKLIEDIPKFKIRVYGFISEHEDIIVCKDIDKVEKLLESYKLDYDEKLRIDDLIAEVSKIKKHPFLMKILKLCYDFKL